VPPELLVEPELVVSPELLVLRGFRNSSGEAWT
jgi:hypothetical protein